MRDHDTFFAFNHFAPLPLLVRRGLSPRHEDSDVRRGTAIAKAF
jgi:hypothetical protein